MANPVSSGKMARTEGMQQAVLYKLIIFAILMAVAPIGTYFGTLKLAWNGNPIPSAICAVVAANIVLVGYVVVAFREDAAPPDTQPGSGLEKRKDR